MKERPPTLLASAKSFLCDLADYEPDKKFDVVRFYGNNNRTLCRITVVLGVDRSATTSIKLHYCDDDGSGDGTVPSWVAAESKRSNVDKTQHATNGHANLLGSQEFMRYLRMYSDQLHRELHATYQKKFGDVEGLSNMYARLRYLVPSAPNAAPNDPTVQVARAVIDKLKLSPMQIYTLAKKNTPDPLSRANAYLVFADVADRSQATRAWALNNAAHIFLDQGIYRPALDLGQNAFKAAEETLPDNIEFRAKAGLITAVAAEALRFDDLATKYGTIAADAGNPKASRFLAIADTAN